MAHRRAHQHSLVDLDDGCLLSIFKHLMPLPDLFQVAQTCWRFHRLTTDKRMWLVVAPRPISPEATPSGRAGLVYTSLKAAVAASRPGDTIWLAPGMVHEATQVTIPWPLHILGGGLQPEDTQLVAAQPADFALSFCASSKLAMLAVSATLCPCLVHRKGLLTVERCRLASDPKGLQHLVSPVVTLAASVSAPPETAEPAAAAAAVAAGQVQGLPAAAVAPVPAVATRNAGSTIGRMAGNTTGGTATSGSIANRLRPSVGSGRLMVVECWLEGGSTAVQCGGTGRLREVRVMYESRAAFFWLEVDSADPGFGGQALAQPAAAAEARSVFAGQRQQHLAALLETQADVVAARELSHANKACEWQKQRRMVTGDASGLLKEGTSLAQQQQRYWQQPSLPGAPSQGKAAVGAQSGLVRIHQVLGRRLNPSVLAAHLAAKQQQAAAAPQNPH